MVVIEVRGIRVYGKHGANAGERDRAQAFDVEVEIEGDFGAALGSDDLRDTLDYAALHEEIARLVRERSFALLERLASELLEVLLRDPRARRARVRIAKPGILSGATPSVTLCRERDR